METNIVIKARVVKARQLRQNSTLAERKLWYYLKNKDFFESKFRRQKPIGNYIVDFVNCEEKVVVELDGGHHNSEEERKKDLVREEYLKKIGYRILRFWNNEVLNNIDGVLIRIKEFVK